MWANTPNLLQIKTQTKVFRDRSGKQFLKEFWMCYSFKSKRPDTVEEKPKKKNANRYINVIVYNIEER